MLYLAIVQYRTDEAWALLERAALHPNAGSSFSHLPYIWAAIETHPDPFFEQFKSTLSLSESQIERAEWIMRDIRRNKWDE